MCGVYTLPYAMDINIYSLVCDHFSLHMEEINELIEVLITN